MISIQTTKTLHEFPWLKNSIISCKVCRQWSLKVIFSFSLSLSISLSLSLSLSLALSHTPKRPHRHTYTQSTPGDLTLCTAWYTFFWWNEDDGSPLFACTAVLCLQIMMSCLKVVKLLVLKRCWRLMSMTFREQSIAIERRTCTQLTILTGKERYIHAENMWKKNWFCHVGQTQPKQSEKSKRYCCMKKDTFKAEHVAVQKKKSVKLAADLNIRHTKKPRFKLKTKALVTRKRKLRGVKIGHSLSPVFRAFIHWLP